MTKDSLASRPRKHGLILWHKTHPTTSPPHNSNLKNLMQGKHQWVIAITQRDISCVR